MKDYLPSIVTVLASLVASGLLLAWMQRRWSKSDKHAQDEAAGTEAILADGAQIRHELWTELGAVRGELRAVQAQQAAGMEERFQLKLSIKHLEKAEEECRQDLEELRKRMTATEAQHTAISKAEPTDSGLTK